jgi:hypothetical protein
MAFSRITYTYTGQTTFAINFTLGYLEESHVTCQVNNEVDGSGDPVYRSLTFVTEGTVSVGGAALETDDKLVFQRTTPKTELENDYQNGALMIESNFDNSFKQAVMIAHEALDGRLASFEQELDMNSLSIINLADGVNAQDAATVNQVGNAPLFSAYAKEWANKDEDSLVSTDAGGNGTSDYSAKHYAAKTAADKVSTNANAVTCTNAAALMVQHKHDAVVGPAISNDNTEGYSPGSRWIDTAANEAYLCTNAATGAAVWKNLSLDAGELGALALSNTVNNSDWSGDDLEVTNGGTGASSASAARTNLGVYSTSEVDALVGGGTVVQMKTVVSTTAFTTTSTSYVDTTVGATLDNDLSSSSNKVLVLVQGCAGYQDHSQNIGFTMFRDTTNLTPAGMSGMSSVGSGGSGTASTVQKQLNSFAIGYLDTPGTVTAQEYSVRMARLQGSVNVYLGRSHDNTLKFPTIVTLMEIAV